MVYVKVFGKERRPGLLLIELCVFNASSSWIVRHAHL